MSWDSTRRQTEPITVRPPTISQPTLSRRGDTRDGRRAGVSEFVPQAGADSTRPPIARTEPFGAAPSEIAPRVASDNYAEQWRTLNLPKSFRRSDVAHPFAGDGRKIVVG